MEAKRPNDTAFETLLTRESLYAQLEMEEYLYSLKLPSDYLDPDPLKKNVTFIGLGDLCELYNLTTEEMDEDLEEDCNKDKEYGCPVKLKPKCFSTSRPLDFVYERWNDTYNISRYDNDQELIDKI